MIQALLPQSALGHRRDVERAKVGRGDVKLVHLVICFVVEGDRYELSNVVHGGVAAGAHADVKGRMMRPIHPDHAPDADRFLVHVWECLPSLWVQHAESAKLTAGQRCS